MSEVKPVYQWQHANRGVLPYSWWQDCTEADFKARDNKMQFNVRIVFETTAVIESLRRDNEALQKENAELKEESQNYENASRIAHEWSMQISLANGELRAANAAQAKRIEDLENDLIEWNEFKKIRDTQMQALRKQMS